MVERWFIVERVEEDWMFYFWCSENQAAADAGAVVLGRQRFVGFPQFPSKFKEKGCAFTTGLPSKSQN